MYIHRTTSALFALLFTAPCLAQGWTEYHNQEDSFSINIPGSAEPTKEEFIHPSEYGAEFPARTYTVNLEQTVPRVRGLTVDRNHEDDIDALFLNRQGESISLDSSDSIDCSKWNDILHRQQISSMERKSIYRCIGFAAP